MDPPESIQVEAPPRSPSQLEQAPQRRRRGTRTTELTLIATISYVILSLFKLESNVRNHSVQNIPREFDSPAGWQGQGKGDTTNIPLHRTHAHAYDLEHNLRALQELTIGKQNNDDDGNNSCPPPLKLYKNQIAVTPSHNHTTTTTKIPQILHLSERSRCLNRDLYDAIQMWQKSFPSFSIFFHDDAAVDRLLYSKEAEYSDWRSEFPDIVKILPCVAPGAMKIDIWRVLVLWKYGGMYSDVDIVPNTDMLTERTIHPDSEWFSLSDAWKRPSQWFFATSAHHMSMKNALHIIAERVLGVGNVQKTKLVHITGPQALYWGWKDSLRNETEKMNQNQKEESESVSAAPPAADQVTGTIITFKDGSWGQWLEAKSNIEWHNASYWGEMVPFEETKCVSRKARSEKHFGRVHWVTAQSSGQTGLPQISCRKHLENLPQKVVEQGEQPKVAATSEGGAPSPSNEAATLSDKSIADLILKNSNNSTMCAYLASENLRKIEELRNNSTYCGFCRWTGGSRPVTCDARMDYMIGKYQLSPEEAFMHVMEKAACKHSTYLNERPPPAHLMAAHMEALPNAPNPPNLP
eukprot:scaffold6903_cov119-Skeletonema_marinoi.AAC.8